ncbi:MAG: hypothetical protein R2836_01080 [Chitinophagales bacterium]|nr:hypothetical protein [Chitinophagales bacterium]
MKTLITTISSILISAVAFSQIDNAIAFNQPEEYAYSTINEVKKVDLPKKEVYKKVTLNVYSNFKGGSVNSNFESKDVELIIKNQMGVVVFNENYASINDVDFKMPKPAGHYYITIKESGTIVFDKKLYKSMFTY